MILLTIVLACVALPVVWRLTAGALEDRKSRVSSDGGVVLPLLAGANPVLSRELRVALRNERAFALLAIYVAVLGAIIASAFPSDTSFSVDPARGGGPAPGYDLFLTFCWTQAMLVLVLVPGLAAGALAQERERQTLESLLLAPLTPLQIVWGKAAGVLAFAALLLLSTVPLTSLCFLLGGVSPGMVLAAYVVLLGLAAFITGLGLYCSARWQSATQATVACYAMLPVALAVLFMLAAPGSIIAGVALIGGAFYGVVLLWRRWAAARWAQRLGRFYGVLLVPAFIALSYLLTIALINSWSSGLFLLAFVAPYFLWAAYLGLQRAAAELARVPDPRRPAPERWRDLKAEWQSAVAPPPVVYLPSPTGRYTYTPQTALSPHIAPPAAVTATAQRGAALVPAGSSPASTESAPSTEREPTYGVRPFLPDNLNPVLAKDLRAGLLGKFSYLFRFSYVVTIGTELLLLLVLLLMPAVSDAAVQGWFAGWAQFHLALLMIAGATLGARSLAPEREQQTLPQLLTTPLTPLQIVQGKMMAVAAYTFYVFVMGVPLALLLAGLGLLPWRSAFVFFVLEIAFGGLAAAWGLYCSLHGVTVRRALGWALGGILVLFMANTLIRGVLMGVLASSGQPVPELLMQFLSAALLPFAVLQGAVGPMEPSGAGNAVLALGNVAQLWPLSVLLYVMAALLLLAKTAADFRRYAQTV